MKMNFRNILLLTFLYYAIAPFNLFASDDDPIYGDSTIMRYTAKEVVIESFKQNRNLDMQPIAASLVTEKELRENNIMSVKEITGMLPNFYMPEYGSKLKSPVFIRGIGSEKDAPSVGLYVDGVPYFDRSTFDFNINDVEHIEVLRGPQGTLYGRNTMGGIINVYTRSPFNYKGTNLNLSAGNYNSYQAGISHYGNIDNKFGYSGSVNYMTSGGYFKNIYNGKRPDGIDAISTRARLSWRIKPHFTAHLVLAYEYSDQDGYPYRNYHNETGEIESINYNSPSFFRRNMSTNGLNLEYVTDNFKLASQSSFQFFDGTQGLDQDFSPRDEYYVDFYQRQQMYSQEFNIKSLKEDSRYEWQFGAFGFHQNYFQTNNVDIRKTGGFSIQNVRNPSGGFALYHQSKINKIFTDGLSLVLGARYDWEKTKSTYQVITPKAAADPRINDMSFSQFTPKASIQYTFPNNGLTYFSVTKGYKTGGFNNTADNEVKEDWTYDPEHSWSYELGAKSNFFDNLLHLDLTLFYIDWKNQQISQPKTLTNGFILRNAGKSASKGVEFSAQINPLKNLSFNASYGYTNAKYKDYKKGDIVYDNNFLIMVPQNTLSLVGNYIVDLKNCWFDNLAFNAQYTGVGKIYWNNENDVVQPYYGMFNGKITLEKKNFSIDLWAKNIGDKDYIAFYFETTTQNYVQTGKPFTCGVNMNLKF